MINENNIQEQVADALIETEEIKDLRQEIEDKKAQIEENADWEMHEVDVDDEIDSIYPEVEIAGHKYSTSNALKCIDECLYDQIKMEMEDNFREEKDVELQDELEDMQNELNDLLGETEEDADE